MPIDNIANILSISSFTLLDYLDWVGNRLRGGRCGCRHITRFLSLSDPSRNRHFEVIAYKSSISVDNILKVEIILSKYYLKMI